MEVHGGEYTVPLDSSEIKKNLLCTLQEKLNQTYLQENINQILEKLREEFPDDDPMKLEARALSDGLREFNLAFRKEALQSLTAIQALKIEELRAKLGFHSVPPSSFNPQR
ncbi:MAG: hypothetical protein KJ573_03645, partial [Proteobacteria bacterium]|nr:hypothetical protein [Pseudomonadota bacterium]